MRFSREELKAMVEAVPFWFHSFDLGHGVTTSGFKPAVHLNNELQALHLPELSGKTVLDIGAMDGFYSFEAERRGAKQVVALDHYAWSLDLAQHIKYMRECRERGVVPVPDQSGPHWRPWELPGKRGYDTIHRALESKVETLVADFMKINVEDLGVFDVVLFLGVLYHMENPLEALKRVARVTGQVAIIETAAVVVPGYEHVAFCEFFESNELDGDMSNWWAPNEKALVGLCRAAGFSRVQTIAGAPRRPVSVGRDSSGSSFTARIWSRTRRRLSRESIPEIQRYRAIVHAWK
jgi:tRNA (mo5U34)-methyltransferase